MAESGSEPGSGWKLRLSGETEELEALAKMFGRHGRVQVWREADHYFLSAPEFEDMHDASEVMARAELWVQRLNGLGLLKFRGFRPVSGGPLLRGNGVYVFPGTGVLYLPADLLRAYVDYTPDRPPSMNAGLGDVVASLPPVERWADVADTYAPDLDDALQLLTAGCPPGGLASTVRCVRDR